MRTGDHDKFTIENIQIEKKVRKKSEYIYRTRMDSMFITRKK